MTDNFLELLKIQQSDQMGCGPSTEKQINIPEKPMLSNTTKCSENSVRFLRKQLIGKGSYGEVFRCIQTSTNIEYAMKVIKINSKTAQQARKQIELLKNEIGLLKKLAHPNIVKYYSFDVTADLQEVEIVLELVKSGTLKEYIEKNGPLSQGVTAQICKKILQALIYLHEGKLIHRDLKCANILLTEQMIPKLTDFGTAKIIMDKDQDNIAKLSASLKGTPYYMAPEILKRTGHNCSADIWSFGCMTIEMLSGKAPWTGISSNFLQIINYISSGVHPPFPPNISRQCTFFLESCLDPIPNQRLKATELIKHRFIDRLAANTAQKTNEKISPQIQLFQQPITQQQIVTAEPTLSQNPKSRNSGINNIEQIELIVEDMQSPEQAKQSRAESKMTSLAQISIQKESNRNINRSKRSSIFRNREEPKKSGKEHIKRTQKYTKEIERLEKLQDEISEVSVSEEEFPKDYYFVKKALVNLKQKRNKGNAKTSVNIKNTEQNLLNLSQSQSVSFGNDLRIKSHTEMTHDEQIINTAISKAERDQYLQQQIAIHKQREDEKLKWEEELKQGAELLKKQFSIRYMYVGR